MTKLTQKSVKFNWGEKEETAFQTLKQKLCSAPILALPEGSENFVVYCDASHTDWSQCWKSCGVRSQDVETLPLRYETCGEFTLPPREGKLVAGCLSRKSNLKHYELSHGMIYDNGLEPPYTIFELAQLRREKEENYGTGIFAGHIKSWNHGEGHNGEKLNQEQYLKRVGDETEGGGKGGGSAVLYRREVVVVRQAEKIDRKSSIDLQASRERAKVSMHIRGRRVGARFVANGESENPSLIGLCDLVKIRRQGERCISTRIDQRELMAVFHELAFDVWRDRP
ncbi:putative reverse transcriptase domain-containing protein [Tanacetum coccineum]|uniref:Reverse transcriptase/retrotransposon-derived protein RNase H-like domain-containing protein n=1 Tax=Tanacetum coccineum TaxID=301880 RepID=A0ABQ4YZZ0_9ASTR